jgi:hypothetical protein
VTVAEEEEEEEEEEAEALGPAICSTTVFDCSGEPSESVIQSAASSVSAAAREEAFGAGVPKLATCELLREGVGWAIGTAAEAVTAGTGMPPFILGCADSVGAGVAVDGGCELDGLGIVGVGCAPKGFRGNNRHPSGKVIGTAVSEPFPVVRFAWFVRLRFATVPLRIAWILFKLIVCN